MTDYLNWNTYELKDDNKIDLNELQTMETRIGIMREKLDMDGKYEIFENLFKATRRLTSFVGVVMEYNQMLNLCKLEYKNEQKQK